MRTVHHPLFGEARQVPESAVDDWRAAGWRLTKPKNTPVSPAAATAADQGQHSDEGEN